MLTRQIPIPVTQTRKSKKEKKFNYGQKNKRNCSKLNKAIRNDTWTVLRLRTFFLTLQTSGLVNKTSCHVRSSKRSPRIKSGHDEISGLRTSTYRCQIRGRLRQVKKRLPDDLNCKLPEFTGRGQRKEDAVRN